MKSVHALIGKTLYAIVFLLILPILMLLWEKHLAQSISWPLVVDLQTGWVLLIGGAFVMLWGMASLILYGNGLPMNAYPPKHFVRRGAYKLFNHPIYIGYGLIVGGYFLKTGSPGGLWLITPMTILSMFALVIGYEAPDLRSRFPDEMLRPLMRLPDNKTEKIGLRDRLSALLWTALGIVVLNQFLLILYPDGIMMERAVSNEISTLAFYLNYLPFLAIILVSFMMQQGANLAKWTRLCLASIVLMGFLAFLYPSLVPHVLFRSEWDVLNIPLFLLIISIYALYVDSRLSGIFMLLLSTVCTWWILRVSPSPLITFLLSALIGLFVIHLERIWLLLLGLTERIANSWKEWIFGKIRIINHGFYVGIGSFLGILLAGYLAGKAYVWGILVFAMIVVVFSAIWAQLIEGSEKLKRPFGYYGALVGIVFASLAVWRMGLDVWVVIGVISVAMPWVQAIGRLRCLINGCCHGKRTDQVKIGIRYVHPRSGVVNLSGMKGKLLHPTPLYAMLWLFVVGLVILELWNRGFSSSFLFGLYLILTGIGRFVEEAYRGEVQTPIIRGLRLYQWTAIASIFIGIIMTCVPQQNPELSAEFGWSTFWAALLGGAFTMFAMGVDFPYSNKRFSRLV